MTKYALQCVATGYIMGSAISLLTTTTPFVTLYSSSVPYLELQYLQD